MRLFRELAGLFRSIRYDLRHSRRARLSGILAILGLALAAVLTIGLVSAMGPTGSGARSTDIHDAGLYDPADTFDQSGREGHSTEDPNLLEKSSSSSSSSSSKDDPTEESSSDHDPTSSHDPTSPSDTPTSPSDTPTSPSDTPTSDTDSPTTSDDDSGPTS